MFGLKLVTGEIVVDCSNGANIIYPMEYKEFLNNINYWTEFDFDDLYVRNEDILEVYNKQELITALNGSTIRFRLAEETTIEIYYTEFESLVEALTAFEYANGRLTKVDKLNGRKDWIEIYEVIGDEDFILNVVK
jgi:hypothetical protein